MLVRPWLSGIYLVHAEHAESGAGPSRLAALSGHAEMSHDSEEWELVSSDLDAENV